MESHLLPPIFDSVAVYGASVEIDAPIEEVWAILSDLKSYPQWNPHLRTAVMVDSSHNPTADQTLRVPGLLAIGMLNPPTMDPSVKPTMHYETMYLVDPVAHRITFGGARFPRVFRAEHAHALSTTPEGKTRYEGRHMFGGVSQHLIKSTMSKGLQLSNQAMADALKERAEARRKV